MFFSRDGEDEKTDRRRGRGAADAGEAVYAGCAGEEGGGEEAGGGGAGAVAVECLLATEVGEGHGGGGGHGGGRSDGAEAAAGRVQVERLE